MSAVTALLVVFMIGKDLAYAPFPYTLRSIAQVACIFAALATLLSNPASGLFKRYWPLWGYLAALLAGVTTTVFPWFALVQIISLFSIILFSIAWNERQRAAIGAPDNSLLLKYMLWMYLGAIVVSLLIMRIAPQVAYGTDYGGDAVGEEMRFRGLFSKPAMMGSAAGLLLGLAIFTVQRLWLRVPIALAAIACLALTQSRTFWIAASLAMLAALWRYLPAWRMRLSIAAGVAVLAGTLAVSVGLNLRVSEQTQKFARLDTVTTLTGRTALWQAAFEAFERRPILGFGFTLGATAFESDLHADAGLVAQLQEAPAYARATTHNGYLQSLLDAGLVGTFFYLATIVVAFRRLMRRAPQRSHAMAFFALTFLVIANCAESVVYSGAVFHSLTFWICAVFAMGLEKGEVLNTATQGAPDVSPAVRFPNLMGSST